MPISLSLALACLHLMGVGLTIFAGYLGYQMLMARVTEPIAYFVCGFVLLFGLFFEAVAIGLHFRRQGMLAVGIGVCALVILLSLISVFLLRDYVYLIWLVLCGVTVLGLANSATGDWLHNRLPAEVVVPAPSLVRQDQLVGLACAGCGKRIGGVLDAKFCGRCGNAIHTACVAAPTGEGGCPTCGFPPADHVRA